MPRSDRSSNSSNTSILIYEPASLDNYEPHSSNLTSPAVSSATLEKGKEEEHSDDDDEEGNHSLEMHTFNKGALVWSNLVRGILIKVWRTGSEGRGGWKMLGETDMHVSSRTGGSKSAFQPLSHVEIAWVGVSVMAVAALTAVTFVIVFSAKDVAEV